MAFEGIQTAIGWFVSSTSFASTDQYSLVKFSSSGTIGTDIRINDTSGEICHGVLDDLGSGSSGSACRVVVGGVTKFRVSSTHGALTVGGVLYARDNGTVNNVSTSTFNPIGYSLEALAADTSGIVSGVFIPTLSPRST